ncbi:Crp/Fnr family transcriptional regulator [Spirosoma soli]|uniref:Crp/Fnr family transcriptional regulator n=1 Tax=Spirosoma soli TaxID=1770529 RepID=A0ABW5M3Q1_9BACT
MFDVFKAYLNDKITLTDHQFDLVQSASSLKRLRKRQFLLQEGDIWQRYAFVCQGCLRIYYLDDKGVEHIMKFCIENWWAGDRESLLTGNPARTNIDALEDSVVLLFNKEDFDQLCQTIPAFGQLINTLIDRTYIASQHRIQTNISYSAEEKYVDFIKTYPAIFNRVPLHMIASYLGVSPETLSRIRHQAAARST